jgi:hypothetical protein
MSASVTTGSQELNRKQECEVRSRRVLRPGSSAAASPQLRTANHDPLGEFLMPYDLAPGWLGRLRLVYGLDAIENLAQTTFRDLNIIVDLQIEPKLSRCAKRLAESKRSIGRNASLLAGNPFDPSPRQAANFGESAR